MTAQQLTLYITAQLWPKHKFIKHVKSRWLTLEGAAERILEQMPALQE